MASARARKFPSANWSVPLTLSAMDLGISSFWAVGLVAEFCGAADFATAARAIPQMIRMAATRRNFISSSWIRGRTPEAQRQVESSRTTDWRQGHWEMAWIGLVRHRPRAAGLDLGHALGGRISRRAAGGRARLLRRILRSALGLQLLSVEDAVPSETAVGQCLGIVLESIGRRLGAAV